MIDSPVFELLHHARCQTDATQPLENQGVDHGKFRTKTNHRGANAAAGSQGAKPGQRQGMGVCRPRQRVTAARNGGKGAPGLSARLAVELRAEQRQSARADRSAVAGLFMSLLLG